MRINQYLAKQGVASRREADKLITAGKVKLNGKVAVLGDQVNKDNKVVVDHKTLSHHKTNVFYFMTLRPVILR